LALVGEEPGAADSNGELRRKAHSILHNIPLIQAKCDGKSFDDISPDDCLASVRDAEGGPDRERLGKLLQEETSWNEAIGALPSAEVLGKLVELARERDTALEKTQGDTFFRLYKLTEQITAHNDWHDKNVCPACDRHGETSVLEHALAKVALYDAATSVSDRLAEEFATVDWDKLAAVEGTTKLTGETPRVKDTMTKVAGGAFTEAVALELQVRATVVRQRATKALATAAAEREELARQLPPSLVARFIQIEG
jgi:hypothetical protein